MIDELKEMAWLVKTAVHRVPPGMRGETVAMGADGTPTSYVDRIAEDAILKFMEESELEFNLLSEEAGFVDRGSDKTLVADPVDGTFNAYSGIPFYSVSLGVAGKSLADLSEGLVMNLVTGDTFHAVKGGGAFLNGKRIHVREPGEDRVLMTYLGRSARPRTYDIASRFRRVRSLGCVSLEICAVAGGQADAFFIDYSNVEKSPRVVDIAGALLVLREAGGEAYDENHEILDMPLSLGARKNMAAVSSRKMLEMMQ